MAAYQNKWAWCFYHAERGEPEGTSSHSKSSDGLMDDEAELPAGPPASLDDSNQANAATSD